MGFERAATLGGKSSGRAVPTLIVHEFEAESRQPAIQLWTQKWWLRVEVLTLPRHAAINGLVAASKTGSIVLQIISSYVTVSL
jgi:hypothetical protein